MDCNEARRWIDASIDGELAAPRERELQQHVSECPACAALLRTGQARHAALATLPRLRARPELSDRIRAAIAAESNHDAVEVRNEPAVPTRKGPFTFAWHAFAWQTSALAAAVALACFVGFRWGASSRANDTLVDEVIADHIRSLQADHLTDVTSTDRHTVKPWFAGKLDFSAPVVDLASQGYPLIGGRLDRLDGHTVAALIYHRRQHTINVFVWKTDRDRIGALHSERDGYAIVGWSDATFNFVAVSEIPAPELAAFAAMLEAQLK
jgi:anti-sigma factor RsiW